VAVFLLLLGINIVIFSFFTTLTAALFFGLEDLQTAGALRYISTLTQIGIFGLTAFECAFLFSDKKPINYLLLNSKISGLSCLFLILIMVVSLPILSHIIAWNEEIKLPQGMSSVEIWMRGQEDAAAKITALMLSGNSVQILLLNLAVIAIIPALCEEFLFRGLLIRWFQKHIRNIHIAVIISALLFSAIHFQFYGFVPRFLLGLYFGYLFIWTGSLWTCIIAHFINNAMAVVVSYLYNNQLISTEYQHFGNVGDNYLLIGLSLLLTTACVYFLYKKKINMNYKLLE